MTFTSVAFDPELHDVATFNCGEPSLDGWLVTHAAAESRRRSARVWVWLDQTSTTPTRVLGYYSLSAGKVAREDLPKALGRGGQVEVPAVLIGRLALDVSVRGQGLGEVLLADALSRIVDATRTVGVRFVVVDALHEQAAVFYERLGFRRLPDSLLLVQKVADIQAAHDASRPLEAYDTPELKRISVDGGALAVLGGVEGGCNLVRQGDRDATRAE